jgi:hypothetical protein
VNPGEITSAQLRQSRGDSACDADECRDSGLARL